MATNPITHDWILHAWITDGINAYDPTWRALDSAGKDVLLPVDYHGVIIDIIDVAQFIQTTEHKSVLANFHLSPTLAKKALRIEVV